MRPKTAEKKVPLTWASVLGGPSGDAVPWDPPKTDAHVIILPLLYCTSIYFYFNLLNIANPLQLPNTITYHL